MNFVRAIFSSKWFGYTLIFMLIFGGYYKYGIITVIGVAALTSTAISLIEYSIKHISLIDLSKKVK
ncbi:hypothetical protein QUF79_08560 [Fictibacillus enclensis]|uniref:hypothetical protein n=1 Tax=Fictibacillus enclensis TaxID=1017270 RepID=UPI0025A2D800|nr:hypothetical protein [Fictibacillus enclensis]MDM5198069.1 hypothetical protein [Fictibacillus enclensis]